MNGSTAFENHSARPSGPTMQVVPLAGVDSLCTRIASSRAQSSCTTGVVTSAPLSRAARTISTICPGAVKGASPCRFTTRS